MLQAFSGLAADRNGHGFSPTARIMIEPIDASTTWVTTKVAQKITGTSTIAVSNFEAMVSVSEVGSDFQNRMLRSLRSSYKDPSR